MTSSPLVYPPLWETCIRAIMTAPNEAPSIADTTPTTNNSIAFTPLTICLVYILCRNRGKSYNEGIGKNSYVIR